MNYQIIVFTLGVMLSILGVAEMVPALVDWADGHANARVFFLNALFCLFFGLSFVLGNKSFRYEMNIRQTFMLTTLVWVFFSLFSAIPFCMADIKASLTDAIFEAVSGYTTTGSTVFTGLDKMSRGILLWRSITHWIGGIGIIAVAIVCLPVLQVGGMQLFQTESSDKSAKLMPKNFDFVLSFIVVYIGISALCTLTYFLLGMSFFDAVNHSMATIATGGFSTHDKSFGYYQSPALHWAGSFFMFASALPFVLYIKLFYQGRFDFFKDDQFNFFCIIIAGIVFVMTAWVWNHREDYTLFESLTHVTFMVVSTITTTGFATEDFMKWGTLAPVVFLYVLYLGGCAGSTAGGIKTMRIVIIFRALIRQIKRLLYPHGAFIVTYQGNPVSQQNVMAVLCFSGLYVITNVVITICLTLVGVDFQTALSGAATAIGNVGYGTGDIIGPAGNFASLPDAAKWFLTLGMLLGRLEIMTALVLFTPDFWKQ